METNKVVGQKLKELRKKKRYTTREVGEFIGISNAYVSKIEILIVSFEKGLFRGG